MPDPGAQAQPSCDQQGARVAQPPFAQAQRGQASTQIGDAWVDIVYGRPILRGRQGIFGSGDSYGQQIYAGAPLWRIGADVTTRITTETDLTFDGQVLEPTDQDALAAGKVGQRQRWRSG